MLLFKIKSGKIIFNKEALFQSVSGRNPKQIGAYLKNPQIKIKKPPYWMFRGVSFKKDKELFKKTGFRYDITVVSPALLGTEFNKTIGHIHECAEIYEVLSGSAIFLFQEKKESPKKIFITKAKKGEKIFIPKNLEHLTINPANKPLILANIVKDKALSRYEFFKKHHGAAYYVVTQKNTERTQNGAEKKSGRKKEKIKFEKNPNYKKVGKLMSGNQLKVSLKKSLYDTFIENPNNFYFLKD